VIIFDNDLPLARCANLEKATGVKVLDRSELILDIFATAPFDGSPFQVELAQLEYSLPQARRCGRTCRLQGRHRSARPGETQLEKTGGWSISASAT